jgi:hypothetical protein
MAAAAGASSSDLEVRSRIATSLKDDAEKPGDKKYKLKFQIDDSIIETEFTYYKDTINDKPAHVLDNTCISLFIYNLLMCEAPDVFSSFISSDKDKPYKCFTPDVGKEKIINKNNGKTFSITDIIQVISTKLKLSLCPANILNLIDVATFPGSYSLVSRWRLLRGEEGIYEKYGYYSPKYVELREKAVRTTLRELPAYMTKIIIKLFPERYSDSLTVAEFMKLVRYEEITEISNDVLYSILDKSELCTIYLSDKVDDDNNHLYNDTTLTGILSRALLGEALSTTLTLDPNSERWRYWDNKIKFIDWIPRVSGGRRRRYRRHTIRKRKSIRIRSTHRRPLRHLRNRRQ